MAVTQKRNKNDEDKRVRRESQIGVADEAYIEFPNMPHSCQDQPKICWEGVKKLMPRTRKPYEVMEVQWHTGIINADGMLNRVAVDTVI